MVYLIIDSIVAFKVYCRMSDKQKRRSYTKTTLYINMNSKPVSCPVCQNQSHYDFSSRDIMFDHYERYDYFKCVNCLSVFQNPMPSDEKINSFYPTNYSVFDAKSQVRKISLIKEAIYFIKHEYKHLKPNFFFKHIATIVAPLYKTDKPDFIENGILLDVGCGNGRYLNTMRQLGWNVQGVELSENGMKVCREANLPVHHGDLISAKFPDKSFDVITLRHVIEPVRDIHPLMAELARILKPRGKLLIETPNSQALGRSYCGANWYANDVPRHLILFSQNSLSTLGAEHGLKMFSCRFQTSPKIILNSLDYITNNEGTRSKKIAWKRLLARFYIWSAQLRKRGDTIHSVFVK